MIYDVELKDRAMVDLAKLAKSEPKSFAKAQALIEELREHPRTGTGDTEQLSGDRAGQWSRRITQKHRLVYEINDNEVIVLILTSYGHYDDK